MVIDKFVTMVLDIIEHKGVDAVEDRFKDIIGVEQEMHMSIIEIKELYAVIQAESSEPSIGMTASLTHFQRRHIQWVFCHL